MKTIDDRDRFIRLVLRNLARMQDLIHDIRALALADDVEREQRWTKLDALVAKVFDELGPDARNRGVRLEIDRALPAATVDATRLEIALVNLIGNAIKYSDARKTDRHATVAARPGTNADTGPTWLIEVRDNGLGIPKDLQRSVFNEHFRAHKDVAEGTGLGLTIARELVASAGGKIWFQSEEDSGTTFFVDVPERGDHRIQQRRGSEASARLASGGGAPVPAVDEGRGAESTSPR